MTLAETAFPYRRRAGRRFKSAMNRDIPNTHTHNGIKISIGTGVFFSRPRAAPTVGSRSVRGRETPHKDRGPVSVGPRYARDGSLSSIVPFCLPSFGPFLHPVPSPSGLVSSLSRSHRLLREETWTRDFNGHFSAGVRYSE